MSEYKTYHATDWWLILWRLLMVAAFLLGASAFVAWSAAAIVWSYRLAALGFVLAIATVVTGLAAYRVSCETEDLR